MCRFAALGVLSVHEGPAAATPERPAGNGCYQIIAKHSGQCPDMAGCSYAHGAPIVRATRNGGSNQVWWFVQPAGRAPLAQGSLGLVPQVGNSVGILVDHTGMVLDVAHAGQRHGAPVVQAFPASGNGIVGLNQQGRFQSKS